MASRRGLRIGVVCTFGALVAAASCRDPTEVTLVLTTDVDCSKLNETSITVGTSDDVTTKAPVAVTTDCNPTGTGAHTIGTLVVIPDSTGASDAFAVRVVSAVGKSATADCVASDGYSGCIVALRELSFVSHTSLTLPIVMRLDCEGVDCGANQTCVEGVCKSSVIDPTRCQVDCSEATLPPPAADAGNGVDATSSSSSGGSSSGGANETGVLDVTPPEDEPPPDESTVPPGPDAAADADAAQGESMDAPVDVSIDVPVDVGVDAKPDAAPDATADASDASEASDVGPFDGSDGDGNVLGSCVAAGSFTGVECAGGRCASGEVCCIEVSGTTVTEACTTAAACNTNSTSPVYSSFACRNRGDCPSGQVCCTSGSATVGNSFLNACATSCPPSPTHKTACQNTCECTSSCSVATCGSIPMGLCGGFCP
jgi:hypothetical protein